MDPGDLKSASNYVNGQLSSRGLLRGNPIDFAKPARDPETPARIINLVHELVQRRDKDADQRENLAITIRSLRNTESKQTATIETLTAQVSDLERKNALLEAQARSFNTSVRSAESSAKTLRDETLRLKTILQQVRTQCANDIRKRDVQIEKMKERILDTRRGTRPAASTIAIKGAANPPGLSKSTYDNASNSVSRSLSDDTTEFLTTLSQTLADENDNILALLRQCLRQLRAVQGLPNDELNPQTEEEAEDALNPVVAPPANYESLSRELDMAMGSLQDMLNQPMYVPVEDLAERDEEIKYLKQRNDVLHQEWKKAIDLVDGWNKGLIESVNSPEKKDPRKEKERGVAMDLEVRAPRDQESLERIRATREGNEGEEGDNHDREPVGRGKRPGYEPTLHEQDDTSRNSKRRRISGLEPETEIEQARVTEPMIQDSEPELDQQLETEAEPVASSNTQVAQPEPEPATPIRRTKSKRNKKAVVQSELVPDHEPEPVQEDTTMADQQVEEEVEVEAEPVPEPSRRTRKKRQSRVAEPEPIPEPQEEDVEMHEDVPHIESQAEPEAVLENPPEQLLGGPVSEGSPQVQAAEMDGESELERESIVDWASIPQLSPARKQRRRRAPKPENDPEAVPELEDAVVAPAAAAEAGATITKPRKSRRSRVAPEPEPEQEEIIDWTAIAGDENVAPKRSRRNKRVSESQPEDEAPLPPDSVEEPVKLSFKSRRVVESETVVEKTRTVVRAKRSKRLSQQQLQQPEEEEPDFLNAAMEQAFSSPRRSESEVAPESGLEQESETCETRASETVREKTADEPAEEPVEAGAFEFKKRRVTRSRKSTPAVVESGVDDETVIEDAWKEAPKKRRTKRSVATEEVAELEQALELEAEVEVPKKRRTTVGRKRTPAAEPPVEEEAVPAPEVVEEAEVPKRRRQTGPHRKRTPAAEEEPAAEIEAFTPATPIRRAPKRQTQFDNASEVILVRTKPPASSPHPEPEKDDGASKKRRRSERVGKKGPDSPHPKKVKETAGEKVSEKNGRRKSTRRRATGAGFDA